MVQEVQWTQEVLQILGILYARDDTLKFILPACWVWCRVTGGEQNTEPFSLSNQRSALPQMHFRCALRWLFTPLADWESLFLPLWSNTRQLPFLDLRKRKKAAMNLCSCVLQLIYVQHSLTAWSGLLGILAQLLRCAVHYHRAQAPNFEVLTVSVCGVRRTKYFILCSGFQFLQWQSQQMDPAVHLVL